MFNVVIMWLNLQQNIFIFCLSLNSENVLKLLKSKVRKA